MLLGSMYVFFFFFIQSYVWSHMLHNRMCVHLFCVSVYLCVCVHMYTDMWPVQSVFLSKGPRSPSIWPLHLLISHLHWYQCDLDGTKCYLDVSWFYFAFSLRRSFSVCLRNGCYFIVFYFNFVKIVKKKKKNGEKKRKKKKDLGLTFSDLLL